MTAPSIRRLRRQATALAAVLAACSTLAACGPGSSPPKEEQPILTKKSVLEVWKDYDKRNNAALVKTGPPSYDASAFGVVDVGPVLDQDFTSVKLAKIEREKRTKPFSHIPRALYAPLESAGFAMSAIVRSSDKAGATEGLTSTVPAGDPATWKMEMSVEVPPRDLPRPLEPGVKSTASKADVEKARKVVMSVSEFWRTHRKPAGIALRAATYADWVTAHADFKKSKYAVSTEAVPKGIPTTSGAGEALRVVRAQGGLLVLVNIRVRNILESREKGITVHWTGAPGKLYGTKERKRTWADWSSSLAITVPDKGRPTVIGATYVPLVK